MAGVSAKKCTFLLCWAFLKLRIWEARAEPPRRRAGGAGGSFGNLALECGRPSGVSGRVRRCEFREGWEFKVVRNLRVFSEHFAHELLCWRAEFLHKCGILAQSRRGAEVDVSGWEFREGTKARAEERASGGAEFRECRNVGKLGAAYGFSP